MATVTGYTAARMKQIEDAAIIKGAVVLDNLILEPHGFATNPTGYPKIDAGNVRGPQGIQGIPGEVTEAELAAGLAATRLPAGTILMWAGDVLPTGGYFWCKGGTADRVAQAALFAAIGTKYGVGNGTTTFTLPNFDNRFPVGVGTAPHAALNDRGGYKDGQLVTHDHTAPAHTHPTPNHQHTIPAHGHNMDHIHAYGNTTGEQGDHQHQGTVDQDGEHAHASTSGGEALLFQGGPGVLGLQSGGVGKPMNVLPNWNATTEDTGHFHHFWTQKQESSHTHGITNDWWRGNVTGDPAKATPVGEGAGTANSGGGAQTTPAGVAADLKNLPPFLTVNFIIKT